jgi:hypothetical protein
MTVTTGTPAPAKGAPAFCKTCYLDGIERQIRGFVLPNGQRVPGLPPEQAEPLRRAAAIAIAAHPEHGTETARHPRHAGSGR